MFYYVTMLSCTNIYKLQNIKMGAPTKITRYTVYPVKLCIITLVSCQQPRVSTSFSALVYDCMWFVVLEGFFTDSAILAPGAIYLG